MSKRTALGEIIMRKNPPLSITLCMVIMILVIQPLCAQPGASEPFTGMTFGPPRWESTADKKWPPSDVVKGYRHASELYRDGKIDEGLAMVKELAGKPLIMGPSTPVIDGNDYMINFGAGRVIPLMAAVRNIIRGNLQKASELSKSGDNKTALQILKVNLQVTRQVMHSKPYSFAGSLSAIGLWRSTWESASKVLAVSGDKVRAASAKQLSTRAKQFVTKRIGPYVNKQMADQKELERRMKGKSDAFIKKHNADYVNNDRAQAGKFIKMWDKEVDSPSYDKLLRP